MNEAIGHLGEVCENFALRRGIKTETVDPMMLVEGRPGMYRSHEFMRQYPSFQPDRHYAEHPPTAGLYGEFGEFIIGYIKSEASNKEIDGVLFAEGGKLQVIIYDIYPYAYRIDIKGVDERNAPRVFDAIMAVHEAYGMEWKNRDLTREMHIFPDGHAIHDGNIEPMMRFLDDILAK
ncbi:MAG: hypothetical protein KJ709_05680 [Nanoarchaeota archaeon]|nr:hypothetical protein [Nanoarchaeota archaeon]